MKCVYTSAAVRNGDTAEDASNGERLSAPAAMQISKS